MCVWFIKKYFLALHCVFSASFPSISHYSEPRIPEIPGLASFPGMVMHSHNYRHPETFQGMDVVVLGAHSSGQDICLEISKAARKVLLSHKKGKLSSKLPENVEQFAPIQSVSAGGTVTFESGEECRADAILFCTGYKFSFPFLSKECKTNVDSNYVTPLYKHVFHTDFSGTLSFLGLCALICPFPLFSIQARFVMSILSGSKSLPSKNEMESDRQEDFQARLESGLPVRHAHTMGARQWRYNYLLAEMAGCKKIDPAVEDLYTYLIERRKFHLMSYKNEEYRWTSNGTWEKVESAF